MGGNVWLCLQAQEGNMYFTELAERVEYGNYVDVMIIVALVFALIANTLLLEDNASISKIIILYTTITI